MKSGSISLGTTREFGGVVPLKGVVTIQLLSTDLSGNTTFSVQTSLNKTSWDANGVCFLETSQLKALCIYFSIWNKKPSETEPSILEQALKKCGWRGPYQQWTERTNELYHH